MLMLTVTAIYYDNSKPLGYMSKPFVIKFDQGEDVVHLVNKRAIYMKKQIKQFVGFDVNGQIITGMTRRKAKAYKAYKEDKGLRTKLSVRS